MTSWQRLADMVPASVALGNDPLLGLRRKITELCDAPAKLLEVGCGSGFLAGWLEDYGYQVYAVDNDSDVLLGAKQRLTKEQLGLPLFFHGDAFAIEDGMKKFAPFDAAYSQGLLEHFSDGQIVELLKQQLALADTVIFSVPSENYPRKEKGDERLLAPSFWFDLCGYFEKMAVATIAYYGGNLHLLGVLKKTGKENGKRI